MILDIEKFNPKKAELVSIVENYKYLEIKGIDDKQGYAIVDEARKDLKRKRVEIQKTGKELREDAVAFQKKIIAVEKELISLIEPLEIDLGAKQDFVDKEKLKKTREILLPERKEKLLSVESEVDDSFLLEMGDVEFESFYNQKRSEFLSEKERKIKEVELKIQREKELQDAASLAKEKAEQAERQRIELEKTRLENERIETERRFAEQARKAELDKQEAIERERQKAEQEKIRLIQEQEEKERQKIKAENEKIALEQGKLKQKNYNDFLAKNDYQEGIEFLIVQKPDGIILYKKIDELTEVKDEPRR